MYGRPVLTAYYFDVRYTYSSTPKSITHLSSAFRSGEERGLVILVPTPNTHTHTESFGSSVGPCPPFINDLVADDHGNHTHPPCTTTH